MRIGSWHFTGGKLLESGFTCTLITHNCHEKEELDESWGHTNRYETPLVCYGCGEVVPAELESAFRILLRYQNRNPIDLKPPFSSGGGTPEAKARYREK